jgi:nitrate/nitrite-specific signal transduction histidine kinase
METLIKGFMNKLFSYFYEMNWRFMRKEESEKGLIMVLFAISLYAVMGFSVYLLTRNLGIRPFWFLLSAIPSLLITLFLSSGFIQEKFKKFESEKVKFGKELDEKYTQLQKLCHSRARNLKEIKELADVVFFNLRQMHREKEVEEKLFHCFRSIIQEDNLNTVRYFIFEQNVKVSKEFRENLKKHFPQIDELLDITDLKHELDNDLKENSSPKIPKRMKI